MLLEKLREKSSVKVNDAELEKLVVVAPPQPSAPGMPAEGTAAAARP